MTFSFKNLTFQIPKKKSNKRPKSDFRISSLNKEFRKLFQYDSKLQRSERPFQVSVLWK